MIVVDTNVIAGLFFAGPHATSIERLLEYDREWCAPPLWRSELRNVVVGYVRAGHLAADDGSAVMAEAEALMEDGEVAPDSASVLRLAIGSGCTAYDCEFVAVAHALRSPLFTYDKALLRAFPSVARTP